MLSPKDAKILERYLKGDIINEEDYPAVNRLSSQNMLKTPYGLCMDTMKETTITKPWGIRALSEYTAKLDGYNAILVLGNEESIKNPITFDKRTGFFSQYQVCQ